MRIFYIDSILIWLYNNKYEVKKKLRFEEKVRKLMKNKSQTE